MKRFFLLVVLCSLLLSGAAAQAQSWRQVGPGPIEGQGFSNLPGTNASGIVLDIAIDPRTLTDSTMYLATGAGGIWKTINSGASWSAKTDGMSILFTGAVALDPSNPSIVYGGIGGPYCCFSGGGIYRSNDGANHWKLLNPNGVFTGLTISAIVLPSSGTLLVATNSGLYKSIDSGQSFGNNAPNFNNGSQISITTPQGANTTGLISDLKLDTLKRSTVYVAIDGSGVYKSIDSGSTFPTTGKLFSHADFPTGMSGDVFIKFGQSTRPQNATMYAFLCLGSTSTDEHCAMLKSVNSGKKWTTIKLTKIGVNQQDDDQILGVDPQDANSVYIGVRQVYYVSDGGAGGIGPGNQIDVNGAHSDDHVIAFSRHPVGSPPTRFYLGTDGGVAATAGAGSAPGQQWSFLNTGLSTALVYAVDIGRGSAANTLYSYGALQDNGTASRTPGLLGAQWKFQCCGDSQSVAVDPGNPLHVLTLNDGGLTCSTDGVNWNSCGNLPSGAAASLVSFDPGGSAAYVAVGNTLYRSKDNGKTYASMHTFPHSITVISQSKQSHDHLWIGQGDGTIQVSTDATKDAVATWSKFTVQGAPPCTSSSCQSVQAIAVDPSSLGTAVVAYAGFSDTADPPKHVFLTSDGGAHWENIGGTAGGGDKNIPDLPMFAVAILGATTPHTIFVGGDSGVFQSADNGKTWQVLGMGFPAVQVTSLALDGSVQPFILRASTFGRSVLQLEGDCPLCPPAAQCPSMTGCVSGGGWTYSLTCTGLDVGIVYNGGCHDTFGEPINCRTGSIGQDTASASWSGLAGPPNWFEPGDQGSPTVCTENAAGISNCKVFTFTHLPACADKSGGSLPQPRCSTGQRYCEKYTPPRCVPANQCTIDPAHP